MFTFAPFITLKDLLLHHFHDKNMRLQVMRSLILPSQNVHAHLLLQNLRRSSEGSLDRLESQMSMLIFCFRIWDGDSKVHVIPLIPFPLNLKCPCSSSASEFKMVIPRFTWSPWPLPWISTSNSEILVQNLRWQLPNRWICCLLLLTLKLRQRWVVEPFCNYKMLWKCGRRR